jgi:Holliday junction resolvase-like predicted endonuclease
MPAKDFFHDVAKHALINDGWTITNDPLSLKWGERDLYVDFGAEKVMVAQKAGRLIAVEVKSFIGASEMRDLHNAVGQYQIYRSVMLRTHPQYTLYLAISNEVYEKLFLEDVGSLVLEDEGINMVIFDDETEVIVKWIH